MKNKGIIPSIKSNKPPIVELDSEVHAAYVRFSKNKVVRTVPVTTDKYTVTIDYDSKDNIVGIELVGVKEFSIKTLLKTAGIKKNLLPQQLLDRTKYIPSDLAVA